LSGAARRSIEDRANDKFVSPASFWELAIKVSLGKYQLTEPYEDLVTHAVHDNGFAILPIEPHHTAVVAGLPFPPGHKDPFDRLLVAQALCDSIPVISGDQALDAYSVTRIW
jgi:PIN domain nuclease of toxin-antitoxin system